MVNKQFNKKEYDKKYAQEHFAQIKFTVSKELKEQFYKKLEIDNIKPVDWFKLCVYEYLDKKRED